MQSKTMRILSMSLVCLFLTCVAAYLTTYSIEEPSSETDIEILIEEVAIEELVEEEDVEKEIVVEVGSMLQSELELVEVYRDVIATTVAMKTNDYYGEGSIYYMDEDSVYLVSAKHLLQYADHVTVVFANGATQEGEVIHLSTQHDFGFVKVDLAEYTGGPLQTIELPTDDGVSFGSYVVIASNQEDDFTNIIGSVLDPSRFFVEFNSFLIHQYCTVEHGMSGAGVFNEDGAYVGMLVGGYGQESASLSYKYIQDEFEELIR